MEKIFIKSLELDIQILHDQNARKGSALLGDAYELWFRHDVIWSSYLAKLCRTQTFQTSVQIGSFERETDRYELHSLLNLYTDNKTYEFHLYILSCLEIYKLQFLNLIYKQKIRQFRKKKEIGVHYETKHKTYTIAIPFMLKLVHSVPSFISLLYHPSASQ